MVLIPLPKKISLNDGICDFARHDQTIFIENEAAAAGSRFAVEKLRSILSGLLNREIAVVTGGGGGTNGIVLGVVSPGSSSESYDLRISAGEVLIKGEGHAGVFRGVHTLLQLIRTQGLQVRCCEIADTPDFANRGFLHDVTRGKVPTLATLKLIVDKLAYYKINQLQLYVEHTFAFSHIPELWQGGDPLTADEITELDACCRRNFIELVPTLATFGHLYELLRVERFEHLNELAIKASRLPHSLWDRMAHYTIDAGSEEGFGLVKSMLDEYLPLFSSGRCNICCDETFDLGKGKNAALAEALGPGRLYVDFVKRLVGVVQGHGKKAMLWGDIVLKYPDLIREIPGDTVFLNWDYGAEVTDEAAKTFAGAGVPQYVCPGVSGWSRFANDITAAGSNIRKMVRYGFDNRADGVLITDWGDCGHVNMLANSLHGMMLGAAQAWNAGSYGDDSCFDAAASTLEWGEQAGAIGALQRELGSLCFYHFGNLYAWAFGEKCLWNREQEVRDLDCRELEEKYRRADHVCRTSAALKASGGFSWNERDCDEFIFSAGAIRWTLALLSFKKRNEYGQTGCPALYLNRLLLLDEGKNVLGRFEELWRKRNKESELRNVTGTFEKIFERITGIKEEI